MRRIVRCVAEGRGDEWEAICLDLDIAMQGQSFEDVFASLNKAIALHIETALDLPAPIGAGCCRGPSLFPSN